jgi:hypothetical protein
MTMVLITGLGAFATSASQPGIEKKKKGGNKRGKDITMC